MSAIQTVSRGCWRAISLPATMLHELTHFVLALPWAEESAIIADQQGMVHGVDWTDDAPTWAIVLSSLGPTFLGALVGLVGFYRLLAQPPTTVNQWLLAAAVAGYWVIYASPSSDDLDIYNNQDSEN